MSELKDCPFCGKGSEPFYSLDPNYQDRHVIECSDCGKQERYEYSKEGAIENWNRRPLEKALQQQNTALQQQVKDLQAENSKIDSLLHDSYEASDIQETDSHTDSTAEIKAAAIREMAIEVYRGGSSALILAIDYANTLSSKGGD